MEQVQFLRKMVCNQEAKRENKQLL